MAGSGNFLVFLAGMTLALVLVFHAAPTVAKSNPNSGGGLNFLTDHSTQEVKNDIKVFLTKMKMRRVPLAKKRSEFNLVTLYKDERELKESVENLETDLKNIEGRKEFLSRSELLTRFSKDDISDSKTAKTKIKDYANNKVKELEKTLAQRRAQLADIQAKIVEAKQIIKNPEAYISIPKEFASDPDREREYEENLLIRDRENMLWRQQIVNNEIEPTWIKDSW